MNTVLLATGWFASLPTFDWQAALIVGAIVTVVAAAVIVVAIATPFVALQGALTLGTVLAIAAISTATGVAGGTAAGFYWGRQGDIKRSQQKEHIASISNRLEIFFEPSEDDLNKAKDFSCTLVYYEEAGLTSREPAIVEQVKRIDCWASDDFYRQVEQSVINWLKQPVLADRKGEPRQVTIYMMPYPGEGVYERLKAICERKGRTIVNRSEGEWRSVLDKPALDK